MTTREKYLLGFASSVLVCVIFFLKLYRARTFHTLLEGGAQVWDPTMVVGFSLIAFIICLLSGVITRTAVDDSPLRLISQGLSIPALLMGLAQQNAPPSDLIQSMQTEVPHETSTRVEDALEGRSVGPGGPGLAILLLVSGPTLTGAAESAVAVTQSEPASIPPLDPPSGFDRLLRGIGSFFPPAGKRSWQVEVARTSDEELARALADRLSRLGFAPELRVLYLDETEDSSRGSVEWLSQDEALSRKIEGVFSVLLGSDLSPEEVRQQQEAARKSGVPSTVWQYPGKTSERPEVNFHQLLTDADRLLLRAAGRGRADEVERLLDEGADANAQDSRGTTPLLAAAERGNAKIVDQLLARGAYTDFQNRDGTSVLMLAAAYGHTSVIESLISAGADMNLQSEEGVTALIAAVRANEIEAVRQLAEGGADLQLRDSTGRTAKGQAVQHNLAQIATYLFQEEEHRDGNP